MTITLFTVGEMVSVPKRAEAAPVFRTTASVKLIETERDRTISISVYQPAISMEPAGGQYHRKSGYVAGPWYLAGAVAARHKGGRLVAVPGLHRVYLA